MLLTSHSNVFYQKTLKSLIKTSDSEWKSYFLRHILWWWRWIEAIFAMHRYCIKLLNGGIKKWKSEKITHFFHSDCQNKLHKCLSPKGTIPISIFDFSIFFHILSAGISARKTLTGNIQESLLLVHRRLIDHRGMSSSQLWFGKILLTIKLL